MAGQKLNAAASQAELVLAPLPKPASPSRACKSRIRSLTGPWPAARQGSPTHTPFSSASAHPSPHHVSAHHWSGADGLRVDSHWSPGTQQGKDPSPESCGPRPFPTQPILLPKHTHARAHTRTHTELWYHSECVVDSQVHSCQFQTPLKSKPHFTGGETRAQGGSGLI